MLGCGSTAFGLGCLQDILADQGARPSDTIGLAPEDISKQRDAEIEMGVPNPR